MSFLFRFIFLKSPFTSRFISLLQDTLFARRAEKDTEGCFEVGAGKRTYKFWVKDDVSVSADQWVVAINDAVENYLGPNSPVRQSTNSNAVKRSSFFGSK